jgi:hypothetical protein
MITISALSTLYVSVPVAGADGFDITTLPGWPTAASVAVCFVGPFPTVPRAASNTPSAFTSWHTATWIASANAARILVGPAGVVSLKPGCYECWIEIWYGTQDVVLWSGPLIVQ